MNPSSNTRRAPCQIRPKATAVSAQVLKSCYICTPANGAAHKRLDLGARIEY
jgi:hypothetical protein